MVSGYTVVTNLRKEALPLVMGKVIDRAMDLSQMELLGNLKRNSPVDEGYMQNSWFPLRFSSLNRMVRSSAKYTPFVNDGTGIYGPKGRKIYPKKGKFLAFKYKGKKIAVPWVRGIKPRRFVERSINQTEKRSDEFVIRAAMEFKGLL
jgi:hypothetical protein